MRASFYGPFRQFDNVDDFGDYNCLRSIKIEPDLAKMTNETRSRYRLWYLSSRKVHRSDLHKGLIPTTSDFVIGSMRKQVISYPNIPFCSIKNYSVAE